MVLQKVIHILLCVTHIIICHTFSLMENNLVTQSNYLIQASYNLTLDEQRLVIVAISICDSSKELPKTVKISAKDYADLYGLNLKNAYTQIQNAAKNLYKQTIDFSSNEENIEQIGEMRWIHSRGETTDGSVTLKFNPDLKPYLSNLKAEFTSYRIRHIVALKSPYSIRLYESICQYSEIGSFWVSIEKFRKMFCIENKYKRFIDIKRRILEPSIKELNKKTNMDITYNVEKKDRKIIKIIFSFKEKQQSEIDFIT